MNKSYWIGLRARITNPLNQRFNQVGLIVTDPDKDNCIVVRFDDGTHGNVYAPTVQIVGEAEGERAETA